MEYIECENNKNCWDKTCEYKKWIYYLGSKIIFPIVGGIAFYAGIKKFMSK